MLEWIRNGLFLFLLFFTYSVFGYLVEVIFCSLHEKKLVFNRGFLLGPYLPIYGVGAIIIVYYLNQYQNDLVALFIMGAVFCSFVEYFTSLMMEKIFKIRWWDYSHMKFNLNGRVCLTNSILFGFGGILIVKVIQPLFMSLLQYFSSFWILFLGAVFLVIFVSDFVLSVVVLRQLKVNASMFQNKDATAEIKEKVQEALSKKTFFIVRVLHAFPKITIINDQQIKEFNDFVEKIRMERKCQKEKRKQKRRH